MSINLWSIYPKNAELVKHGRIEALLRNSEKQTHIQPENKINAKSFKYVTRFLDCIQPLYNLYQDGVLYLHKNLTHAVQGLGTQFLCQLLRSQKCLIKRKCQIPCKISTDVTFVLLQPHLKVTPHASSPTSPSSLSYFGKSPALPRLVCSTLVK